MNNSFRSLVNERAPGIPFILIYPILWIISIKYACLLLLRNLLYDRSIFKKHSVKAPVISVGNITTGGVGKTPLVRLIAEEAKKRGLQPAVVARGYKGERTEKGMINDEGLMLQKAMPDLVLVQNPDRVAGALEAIDNRGADLLIMDDGFQHRRLSRDMDIVVIDATCPFGFGRVLPAGILREPMSGLRRAQSVVITRCDQVSKSRIAEIENVINGYLPDGPVFKTEHAPDVLSNVNHSVVDEPSFLEGKKVYIFCAIANPQAFKNTILSLGAEVSGRTFFPDHYWYRQPDIDHVLNRGAELGAEIVVTTAKDCVKLTRLNGVNSIRVLDIGLRFQEEADQFWRLVFP